MSAPKFPLRASNNLSRTQSLYSSNKAEASKRTSWFGGIFQRKKSQTSAINDNKTAVKDLSASQRRKSAANSKVFNGGKRRFSIGACRCSLKLTNTNTKPTLAGVNAKTDLATKKATVEGYKKEIAECKKLLDELSPMLKEAQTAYSSWRSDSAFVEKNRELTNKEQVLYDHVRALGQCITMAEQGIEKVAMGRPTYATEQSAYESLGTLPSEFWKAKRGIEQLKQELEAFKADVPKFQAAREASECKRLVDNSQPTMAAYSDELRELVRLAPNIIQKDKADERELREHIAKEHPNKPLSQLPSKDVVSLLGVDLNHPPEGMEQAAEDFKKYLDMKPDELPIDIRDQIALKGLSKEFSLEGRIIELNKRIKDFKPENFQNNSKDVQVEAENIQKELRYIQGQFLGRENIQIYNTIEESKRELKAIRTNVQKMPESDEKKQYLETIERGLKDLDNTHNVYKAKNDPGQWAQWRKNVSFYDLQQELKEVKELINTIPESVRKGEGLENVSKTQTASVSNVKPSQAEIDAAQDVLNQTYEAYGISDTSGSPVDRKETYLKDSYDTQMKYLQLMRERIVNDKKLGEEDKWALISKINNQMRATRSEFNEAQKTYKDSEIVQGYKAVKTAIRNLQDAVDGKGGDLKTCQEQLEKSSKELLPELTKAIRQKSGWEDIPQEDIQNSQMLALGQIMHSFKMVLKADASKFIQDMAKQEIISKDLQANLEQLNPNREASKEVNDHNEAVNKQCDDAMRALKNLRKSVKETLLQGHERTEFLKEINQSFEKLRNLKRNKQANADTSLVQRTKLQTDFKAEFEKITAFQAKQTKRLDELKNAKDVAGNFNEGIKKKCNDAIKELEALKEKVQNELKDKIEDSSGKEVDNKKKTTFLADIDQGITEIGDLNSKWKVNADSLPNLTDRQKDFDKALNDVMQLTKSLGQDRLEKLKQAQKPKQMQAPKKTVELKQTAAPRNIDQGDWDKFNQDIYNRYNQQTKFLESLKSLANGMSDNQRNAFNELINDAIEECQITYNSAVRPPKNSDKGVQNLQTQAEKKLDEALGTALQGIIDALEDSDDLRGLENLESIKDEVTKKGNAIKKEKGWNFTMERDDTDGGDSNRLFNAMR